MKKNKTSKSWIHKQNRDLFFKKSKIQGYRSRSAFKLIEMNNKFKFLNKSTNLLDLGSSPGGWSQVAREKIFKGKILATDIKNIVITSAIRTAIGTFRGSLKNMQGHDLGSIVVKEVMKRSNLKSKVTFNQLVINLKLLKN